MHLNNEFEPIREWARERGLYEKGDPKTQMLKLVEEVGELGKAILKSDPEETIDAIGDCVVVLTNLIELASIPKELESNEKELTYRKTTIEDCINSAYAVIASRSGKMINGTFVKDEKYP
jgi:NTP pyrophosphatase (non-canonical NTP hydrolase)